MLILSIISLLIAIAALVLAVLARKANKDAIADLQNALSALEKKVKSLSLTPITKPVETEKEPLSGLDNIILLKDNTVTISGNLSVEGWVAAGTKE